MNTSELRVNNLVLWNNYIVQIETVYRNAVSISYENYDFSQPLSAVEAILLTPEIIEKISTSKPKQRERTNDYEYFNRYFLEHPEFEIHHVFESYGGQEIDYFTLSEGKHDRIPRVLQHLHQLQNIYYMFTDSELNTQSLLEK